jgi:hypothetical protein
MSYSIAGIDVHKKMLAVVVSDVEVDGEYRFERRMFGSNPEQLRSLAGWLLEQEAEEVVMESTAQYWKPVWEALGLRKATATCGAFSARRPTLRQRPKEASSTLSIAVRSRAWDIIKPSGPLPIDNVG